MFETLEDARDPVNAGAKRDALDELLGRLEDPDEVSHQALSALGFLLSSATADEDIDVLNASLDDLQRLVGIWEARSDAAAPAQAERRGVLIGLIEMVRWTLERLDLQIPESALGPDLERGAIPFLEYVAKHPRCGNQALADALDLSKSRVSRLGSHLHNLGLARRRKVGLVNEWDLTRRGARLVDSFVTRTSQGHDPTDNKDLVRQLFEMAWEEPESVRRFGPPISDDAWTQLDAALTEFRARGGGSRPVVRHLVGVDDTVFCTISMTPSAVDADAPAEQKEQQEVWRVQVTNGRIINLARYVEAMGADVDATIAKGSDVVAEDTPPELSGASLPVTFFDILLRRGLVHPSQVEPTREDEENVWYVAPNTIVSNYGGKFRKRHNVAVTFGAEHTVGATTMAQKLHETLVTIDSDAIFTSADRKSAEVSSASSLIRNTPPES